jgi:hypothetical protein
VRRLALLFLVLGLGADDAGAWPAPVMQSLSRDARRLLPRSLAKLLAEREAQIVEEAGRLPGPLTQALAADLNAGRLQPDTLAALDAETARVVATFHDRQLSEGLVRMGALLRVAADVSDPVLSVGPGGYPPGVTREYYAFVGANLAKIPVVIDDEKALSLKRADLPAYWQRLLDRSRAQSPVIGTELFREGRLVSHKTVDFRSPVFGVASLSYSRAVTAIAASWLAVWREARGDLTRMRAPRRVAPRDGGAPPPTAGSAPAPARPEGSS